MKKDRYFNLLLVLSFLFSNFSMPMIGNTEYTQELTSPTDITRNTRNVPLISSEIREPPHSILDTKLRPRMDESPKTPSVLFIENVGQFDPQARFQVRGGGDISYLSPEAIWMTYLEPLPDDLKSKDQKSNQQMLNSPRNGVNLRISFVGANPYPEIVGFNSVDTDFSFYIGNNPEQWHTHVPVWGGARYIDIYPGVDLEISSEDNQWTWEIVGNDDASLDQVRLQVDGADKLALREGSVIATTSLGEMTIPLFRSTHSSHFSETPVIDGNKINLPFTENIITMSPEGNRSSPNRLLYSMFLTDAYGYGIVVDELGSAYVTGEAVGTGFPGSYGSFLQSVTDGAFVIKLTPEGDGIVYCNIFADQARGEDIDIDMDRKIYITGYIMANTLPLINPYQSEFRGSMDSFLVKFDQEGIPIYSTYFGGSGNEYGYGIKVGEDGSMYIAGQTTSYDFEFVNAVQETCSQNPTLPCSDAYVTRFSSDGQSIIFSTYLGGSGDDEAFAIDLDASGNAYVTGVTTSLDFPLQNAYQSGCGGGAQYCYTGDIFLTVLCADGPCTNGWAYSTYYGDACPECGYDIYVDKNNYAYIVGCQVSGIGTDALVLKFDPWKSGIASLVFRTWIGGSGANDEGYGISIDTNSYIYVTGYAMSDPPGFPITPDAYKSTRADIDGFLVQLDPGGSVKYATYIGGSSIDAGRDVALGQDGSVYVLGSTGYDWAFVIKFSTGVPDESTYDSGNGGLCSAYGYTQKYGADPINTRTGGYDQSVVDLSVPTTAGPLELQRWYSSQATDIYSTTLGFGWTYNLDARLIFPDDPGGKAGMAQFKSQSSNIYFFYIDGVYADLYSGTFTPYPGLCGELISLKDIGGSLIGYLLTDSAQQTFTFDTDGLLLNWKDAQGHTISFEHTHQGGLTRLRHVNGPNGEFINLYYDDRKNKLHLTRAEAGIGGNINQVSYSYTNNNLTGVVDVIGHTWHYQYDDPINPHLLTKVIDPNNVIIERTVYDSQGRAIEQYNGENELVMGLVYTGTNTTLVYDALLISTRHSYDQRSTVTDIEDPFGGNISREYDINFRPTAITDPLGNTTSFNWSADGNNLLQTVQMIDSGVSIINTMEYDSLNNLTQIVDAKGYTTTYSYNGTLQTGSIDALNNTTQYTYTTSADGVPPGLLKEVRDPLNNHTWYTYNSSGQLISMRNELNQVINYAYDPFGRLQSTTNSTTGRVDWTCYDAAGRVVRTIANLSTNPPTDPCSAAYPPGSDLVHDRIQDIVLDVRGNTIATVEWTVENSAVVSYTTRTYYDSTSRPTAVVQNLKGQSISNPIPPEYNPNFPDQNVHTRTVYNADGTVMQTIGNAGNVIHYCYDSLKRIIRTVQNPTVENPCASYTPGPSPDQDVVNDTVYDVAGNAIATIDSSGRIIRTYYDELNRPETVVNNLIGNIQDPPPSWNPDFPDQNVRSDTIYDLNGNVQRTIDNAGRITHYCYNKLNRMVMTVANLSSPSADPCDSSFVPSSNPDQDVIFRTVYDGNGNAIASIDPLGIITRTYYDALNRPELVMRNVSESDIYNPYPPPCNRGTGDDYVCTQTIYGDDGNVIATIDPLGRITRTYYDGLDRPVMVIRNLTAQSYELATPPDSSLFGNDENVAIETRYDNRGQPIATIEWWVEAGQPVSRVTRSYFDKMGRPVAVVRNLVGQTIENPTPPSYNPAYPNQNIRVDTVYGARGDAIATYEYLADGNGQLFIRTNRTYYDNLGRPVLAARNLQPGWDPLSPVPPDCNRDTTGTLEPYNVCNEIVYERNGEAIAAIEPLGHITRTYYDGLSRQVAIVANLSNWDISIPYPPDRNPALPDINSRTDMVYNREGNQSKIIDPNGISKAYEYDGLDRLTAVIENYIASIPGTNEINVRTEYTYDKLGRLLKIRDANAVLNNTTDYTTYGYDDLGRQVSETDPLMNNWTYTLDVQGNRVLMMDANGSITNYLSDGLDRVELIDYADPDPTVTYAYNALGWRLQMTDGMGTTIWEYDPLRNIRLVRDPFNGEIDYTYDALGNRTSIKYPDGKIVTYTYDSLGRLQQTKDWNDRITTSKYDVAGYEVSTELPNGVTTAYLYNGLGKPIQIDHNTITQTLSSYQYSYDAVGNRMQAIETLQDGSFSISTPIDTVIPTNTTTISPTESILYNAQLNDNTILGGPITIIYNYDPLNRLVSAAYSDSTGFEYDYDATGNIITKTQNIDGQLIVTQNAYDSANKLVYVNGQPYTWDNNGNLLNDGANNYTYDHANRLKSASEVGRLSSYAYNGMGDRLQQTVNSTTTSYTLDLAGGLTQVLADETHIYLYGYGRIAQYMGTTAEYFLRDALGSVRQLTDENGNVTLAKDYEPYGEVLNSAGSASTAYGYTGEWTDNTGLVYLRARYYDPTIARFMTKDRWGGNMNQPMSFNHWIYVESNPINRIDPTGKWYCQSGLLPSASDCKSWVKEALFELDVSGVTGNRLVQFFNRKDGIFPFLNKFLCQPLPILPGIKIYFESYTLEQFHPLGFAIWPDKIYINSEYPGYSGPTPSKDAVVTFGHEISHLSQRLSEFSVQAEVLSTIVTYYLERDLGVNHRPDSTFIIEDREIDPWSLTDLKTYKDKYHDLFGSSLPWPLIWVTGLPRNWLEGWGITLPYPISHPPEPEPIPIPKPIPTPPHTPPGTPSP